MQILAAWWWGGSVPLTPTCSRVNCISGGTTLQQKKLMIQVHYPIVRILVKFPIHFLQKPKKKKTEMFQIEQGRDRNKVALRYCNTIIAGMKTIKMITLYGGKMLCIQVSRQNKLKSFTGLLSKMVYWYSHKILKILKYDKEALDFQEYKYFLVFLLCLVTCL